MKLETAKRWYEFVVGQIVEDIDGTLCIRLLNKSLVEIPQEDKRYLEDYKGWIVCFWQSKKTKTIKNIGVVGTVPQRLTESEVEFIWNLNYGHLY